MKVEIYNNSRCIKLVLDNRLVAINKQQIKTMNTIDGDKVEIDIGEGPMKLIYIRSSEVTIPNAFASATDLLNYFVDLWVKGLDCCNDTKAKMDEQTARLGDIKTLLQDIKAELKPVQPPPPPDIFTTPLQVDNTQPGIVYNGYAAQGTQTDAVAWAIKQTINQNGNAIELWSNGNKLLNNVWVNRANINYLPLAAV